MKLFLDENLPLSTIDALNGLGFEITHVRTEGLRGASDKRIASYAKEQKAILITKDLEFGNLTIYPKGSHYGLIVVRLPNNFSANQVSQMLKHFLSSIDTKELINAITILEIGKYRIRRL